MNRSERNNATDSLRDFNAEDEEQAEELVLSQPLPLLDTLIQRANLPDDSHRELQPSAEAVINRIAEVTELNQTSERMLERRHEVKDFAASKNHQVEMASRLSDILEPKKQQLAAATLANSASRQEKGASLLRHLTQSRSLYGYAIRYGFVSGLLALLVAILAVVLFT